MTQTKQSFDTTGIRKGMAGLGGAIAGADIGARVLPGVGLGALAGLSVDPGRDEKGKRRSRLANILRGAAAGGAGGYFMTPTLLSEGARHGANIGGHLGQMSVKSSQAFNPVPLQIKLASALLRLDTINTELAKYNLTALQKSAAAGSNKETRLKVAALIRQREIEKQAFVSYAARAVGSGIQGLGNSMQQGLNSFADSADQWNQNMYDQYVKPVYRKGQMMYHKATAPIRTGIEATKGFGQGLMQGANSMMAMPGAVGNAMYQGMTGGLGGASQPSGSGVPGTPNTAGTSGVKNPQSM